MGSISTKKLSSAQKLKAGITFFLSAYAVILLVIFPSFPRALCLAAMAISTLGDLILMNFYPLTKYIKKHRFMLGVSVFGMAHIFYMTTYFMKMIELGAGFNTGTAIAVAVCVCAIAFLHIFYHKYKKISVMMLILGTVYIAVLSINSVFVFTYAFAAKGLAFITAFGAFSFFLSDMIIAINTVFGLKVTKRSDIAIWIPYVIGQILLIAGV